MYIIIQRGFKLFRKALRYIRAGYFQHTFPGSTGNAVPPHYPACFLSLILTFLPGSLSDPLGGGSGRRKEGRRKNGPFPPSSLPVSPLGQCGSGPTLPCLPSCLLLETAIKIPKTALAAAHFNFPNLHNLCLISANHKRRLFARKICGARSSLLLRALQGGV